MLVTESKAKEMLCPFKLTISNDGVEEYKYHGSKCMLWKWLYSELISDDCGQNYNEISISKLGFCGLLQEWSNRRAKS